VAYSQPMIEAGSTRTGRWLRERRVRIALWVAVVEGLIAAFSHDIGRWTILIMAVIVLAFYIVAGRQMKWDVARQLSWIAAASQVLAILVVIFAFILKLVAIVVIVGLALVALYYLFSDHKQQRT
jgi:apolipoprotein N-acyltransferase